MVKKFLDVLARHTPASELEKLDPVARQLDVLSRQLAAILSVLNASTRSDLLELFDAEVLASLREIESAGARSAAIDPCIPQGDNTTSAENCTGSVTGMSQPINQEEKCAADNITPEMREWARQNKEALTPEVLELARQGLNIEQVLADIQEVCETGGLELRDFIQELEQLAAHRE